MAEGVALNDDDDMSRLIERVRDSSVVARPNTATPREDFARYGEPASTKH